MRFSKIYIQCSGKSTAPEVHISIFTPLWIFTEPLLWITITFTWISHLSTPISNFCLSHTHIQHPNIFFCYMHQICSHLHKNQNCIFVLKHHVSNHVSLRYLTFKVKQGASKVWVWQGSYDPPMHTLCRCTQQIHQHFTCIHLYYGFQWLCNIPIILNNQTLSIYLALFSLQWDTLSSPGARLWSRRDDSNDAEASVQAGTVSLICPVQQKSKWC